MSYFDLLSDEVAVIDEIQMMKDDQRGWAWTRALLGVQAEEIHVCGEISSAELLRGILQTTGEDIEVFFCYELGKILSLINLSDSKIRKTDITHC
jgi:hypothetical protein